MGYNKEEIIFSNQNKKLIEINHHKNIGNSVHHVPKIVVGFEHLWMCLSKIIKTTQRRYM